MSKLSGRHFNLLYYVEHFKFHNFIIIASKFIVLILKWVNLTLKKCKMQKKCNNFLFEKYENITNNYSLKI